MLQFLKNIFSKKTEKTTIKLEELEGWFNEKTKNSETSLQDHIKQKVAEIEYTKQQLDSATQELTKAVPQDQEKIIPKIKNVVEGARKDYTRQLTHLIKEVIMEEGDSTHIIHQCKAAQKRLDMFAQATAKSYYTTQHLYHKQVEEIAKNIKQLDSTIKELELSVKTSEALKAKQIKNQIEQMNEDIKTIKELKQLLAALEKQKQEQAEKEINIEQKIQELRQSQEYKQHEQEKQKLQQQNIQLNKKSDEIFELIAPLETALKKYERITLENQKTIKKYLENCVEALIQDKTLELIQITEHLKSSIEKSSIDLKEEKKDKTIKIISTITEDQLKNLQAGYEEIQQQIKETQTIIEQDKTRTQEAQLEKAKQKIEEEKASTQVEIAKKKELISKMYTEKEKKEIANKIQELMGIELDIE